MPNKLPVLFLRYQFYFLLVAAVIALQIPFISIPLNWLEAYFHELSHGLASLLTGGSVVQIQLFANGSGLCTTRGGSAFLISLSGYLGATLWGCALYSLSAKSKLLTQGLIVILVAMLTTTLIFWARDVLTFVICLLLLIMFISFYRINRLSLVRIVNQFIGLVVILNALQSPLFLIDGKPFGDGAALAKLTLVPEIFWVTLWFLIGLIALVFMSRKQYDK